ncbi:MAG: Zn-ribbon domain-containing OB-fold protein [Acidimicrobiales bacterium]
MTTDEDLLEAWPGVRIDRDNAAYYRGLLERRLLLNRCADCGAWHNPPRPLCPRCWSWAVAPTEVSGRGRIALLTFLHQGPRRGGVDYTNGFPAAAIELEEQPGLRVSATIVDAPRDQIRLGLAVELAWQEHDGRPSPAFRPAS